MTLNTLERIWARMLLRLPLAYRVWMTRFFSSLSYSIFLIQKILVRVGWRMILYRLGGEYIGGRGKWEGKHEEMIPCTP